LSVLCNGRHSGGRGQGTAASPSGDHHFLIFNASARADARRRHSGSALTPVAARSPYAPDASVDATDAARRQLAHPSISGRTPPTISTLWRRRWAGSLGQTWLGQPDLIVD